MPFTRFISIVLEIFGSYYFIIILSDILKSNNKAPGVTTHAIQFTGYEKPITVSDDPEENNKTFTIPAKENLKKYLPVEHSIPTIDANKRSPIIDLGLEILSGEPYTVNAENLSKFMIA